jgi:hypothetical protein
VVTSEAISKQSAVSSQQSAVSIRTTGLNTSARWSEFEATTLTGSQDFQREISSGTAVAISGAAPAYSTGGVLKEADPSQSTAETPHVGRLLDGQQRNSVVPCGTDALKQLQWRGRGFCRSQTLIRASKMTVSAMYVSILFSEYSAK